MQLKCKIAHIFKSPVGQVGCYLRHPSVIPATIEDAFLFYGTHFHYISVLSLKSLNAAEADIKMSVSCLVHTCSIIKGILIF